MQGLELRWKFRRKSTRWGWCKQCPHTLQQMKERKVQRVHVIWLPGAFCTTLCTRHYLMFVAGVIRSYREYKKLGD